MAPVKEELSFCVVLLCILISCALDAEPSDSAPSCEEQCEATYPLHTYPESQHLTCCLRGCRFFSIIDTVEEYNDVNVTRKSCITSCGEAYKDVSGDEAACKTGCEHQQPFFSPLEQYMMREMDSLFRPPPFDSGFFLPFLYIRDSYSNMVDKLSTRTSVSWSFYIQNDDGKMMVIRSEPAIQDSDMTSNVFETNLGVMDDSATPDINDAPNYRERPYGADESAFSLKDKERDEVSADWLSCISRKTGLPRMLLTFAIMLSALGMLWLAITTTVTASEHRIHRAPEKISYYGDLEYMSQLGKQGLLTKVTPIGPEVQAPPLPMKLQIQDI